MALWHKSLHIPGEGNGRAPFPCLLHPVEGMVRAWGRWTSRACLRKSGTLTFG